MHPDVYHFGIADRLESLRSEPKRIRVFFGGNTGEPYVNADIEQIFGMANRKIVTDILDAMPGMLKIASHAAFEEAMSAREPKMLLLGKNVALDIEEWMRTLTRSDFFIAAPGVSMPFSHNVIEAMAVGTIPVLQYGELFAPPLTDGGNCIVFDSENDLVERLEYCRDLSPDAVAGLRKGVLDYYDTYLRAKGRDRSTERSSVVNKHNVRQCRASFDPTIQGRVAAILWTKHFLQARLPKPEGLRTVDRFLSRDIVRLYMEQEALDVAKYFSHGPEVLLLKCEDTGLRFYYPFETAGDEDFYKQRHLSNEARGSEYDRDWSEDHQFAYDRLITGEKLLEIGCATGKFLERAKQVTSNVSGLELNPISAAIARKKGFDVHSTVVEKHAVEAAGEYDVVCAFQVLEHVTDPGAFLAAAIDLLKQGGKLIVSVPNSDPFYQRFNKYDVLNMPPHHMGLWTLAALKKLEGFFPIRLAMSEYFGHSSVLIDAYLRAKLIAGVKSLPRRHTVVEKAKMLALAPYTVPRSAADRAMGKGNHAYVTVIFEKIGGRGSERDK